MFTLCFWLITISNYSSFVLRVGLEPTRPCGQGILSPSCLPFHHQSIPVPAFRRRLETWAENETRTRDPDLGKVVLYQLSYFRLVLFQTTLFRAENETRTRDPDLGKVVLYQLSYFRIVVHYFKWLSAFSSKGIFSSKAGAKVQTFFHSAKLFFKKSHNSLITRRKFFI